MTSCPTFAARSGRLGNQGRSTPLSGHALRRGRLLAVPEPQRVLLESLFVPQDLTDARTSIRSTPTPSPMPCTWLTMPLSERRERQSVLKQKVMRTTVEAYCRRFIEALEAPAVARAA